ncbi:MAG: hypothetical protein QT00_C0001G0301 [archaeon GW2011_AR5]|nr:MAG: hypothetical protein QT00_C0001G0301 [archaeon GW2011_AR5]MBS3050966.1 alpha/beta hydrolase [Candidatus Aenigmarchaeota archaeon]
MPVIVISGKPGCGSSTTAKLLAKRLQLRHFSLGDYNKSHSRAKKETDKSLDMWKIKGQKLKSFHLHSDKLARSIAKHGDVVIDAKLGIRMIKGLYDCGIWLTASGSVRTKRYAKRDSITLSDAARKLREKELAERKNWKNIYGFDYFTQEKEADIVIDTGNRTPEQIVDMIISRMKRVFIVHRWNANPKSDWYVHCREELEKKGFIASVPRMPNTRKPALAEWLPFLRKAIGAPTGNTFLVGHSAGVATILRYLETLKKGEKIGGCVLVAGWTDNLGYKQLTSFVSKPFNWKKIRRHCKSFVVIDSDNDPYVKLYHGKAFEKQLKAKLITERGKGHLDDDSRVKKLPSVIKTIKGMTK